MNVGDEIKADTFAKGDHIDVTGISKGKGYQGVIKRCERRPRSDDPRRRPGAPPCGLHGLRYRSFPDL